MGKVICDVVTSDTSGDEQRKTVREKQKNRTKKKKRKRDLTDLHQKIFKSKKQNEVEYKFWQSNFIKLLHHFADIREEYDKKTKIDGKLGTRSSKRISNRILPKALSGIYRNGATGKEIRRSQTKLPLDNLNNARLEGNVLKLLDGYDSKSEDVVKNNTNEISKNILFDSAIKNILQPTPVSKQDTSPVLGNTDGKKRYDKDDYIKDFNISNTEFLQKQLEKKKPIDSKNLGDSALRKYEELCIDIFLENFEEPNFPDHLGTDPLIKVKKKLRNIYAESFRSQFLRDMIKRGNILIQCDTPSTSNENFLSWDTARCPSSYTHNTDFISKTIENTKRHINYKRNQEIECLQESQDSLLIPETNFNLNNERNENVPTKLLFDISSLSNTNIGVKNFHESEMNEERNNLVNDVSTDASNPTSLEVNHSTASIYRNNNTLKYSEANKIKRIKEKNKPVLFAPSEIGFENNFINENNLMKGKNQSMQTVHILKNELKRHQGRQNLKILKQVKMKNLKNKPAILRRCNNTVTNNNNRLNLFQESMTNIKKAPREMLFDVASKQEISFPSQSVTAELNEDSKKLQRSSTSNTLFDTGKMKNLNVMDSPSVCDNEIYFMKKSCSQPTESKQQSQNLHVNDIFVNKKNPPVQKTVMFTKKDSRNIGQCLYVNNLIARETADNSNVCIIRKNVPLQHEKSIKNTCTVQDCQKVSNCYRTFHCSQNSENSNYGCQEFKEAHAPQIHQIHQKPMVYEKILLKKIQQQPKYENNQKCDNNQHVYYVMVDQCKDSNNLQKCSHDNVSQIEKPRTLHNGRLCQEDVTDVSILKGVHNLKILPVEEQESQIKFIDNQYIQNGIELEQQPIKYLAFENDSKTQKVPIYKHVTSVDNVEVTNSNANYRVISCLQEPTQKIIFVPTCEQNKVVYVEQQNLGHSNVAFEEQYSHPKKIILYRPEVQPINDSSNVCEIHVPKQNVVEIRKTDCEPIVTTLHHTDKAIKSRRNVVNWEELHYRPNYEHNACVKSQAVFYQK